MIVVGGTYHESCLRPEWDYLAGSGLRAAAAITDAAEVSLHTAISASERENAEFVFGGARVSHVAVERSEPVRFDYFTPLSSPAVTGPNATMDNLYAEDDTALVFGFVENGQRRIAADTLVFDPQQPRDVKPVAMNGLISDEIVVVANHVETLKLCGLPAAGLTLDDAAHALHRRGVDTVVTKRGARGSEVRTWNNGSFQVNRIGAHPTSQVWPLGAGDVFSAALTYALHQGADAVEAARVASAAAAHWSQFTVQPTPISILNGTSRGEAFGIVGELKNPAHSPRVYLAGPFFSTPERWLVDLLHRELVYTLGVDVFSPVHDVGIGDTDVAAKDLAGLAECTSVLALLDGSDPGTIFEVGWAVRAGIPVVGFADRLEPEAMKMLAGSGVEIHRDLSSAAYRAVWAAMGSPIVAGWRKYDSP